MTIATRLVLCAAIILSTASSALAKGTVPAEPYGTPAQQQKCVADMEASLHGDSILGHRGTSSYIQSLGGADWTGTTEYDIMVGRCMEKLYHRYVRPHARRPR
jgi:hypothetical protein